MAEGFSPIIKTVNSTDYGLVAPEVIKSCQGCVASCHDDELCSSLDGACNPAENDGIWKELRYG